MRMMMDNVKYFDVLVSLMIFSSAGQNVVCLSVCLSLCVWMLTRVAQIIAAAHRDL